jgi:hypothetical protein
MSKHLSAKLASKLEKEELLAKENGVRFTVTRCNMKGKVLNRDWFKGFIGITGKRLVLASEGKKFINIKGADERYSLARFEEDNVACLEVKYREEPESKQYVIFHIYTTKAHKFLRLLEALA